MLKSLHGLNMNFDNFVIAQSFHGGNVCESQLDDWNMMHQHGHHMCTSHKTIDGLAVLPVAVQPTGPQNPVLCGFTTSLKRAAMYTDLEDVSASPSRPSMFSVLRQFCHVE